MSEAIFVLDASALLALMLGEAGADVVAARIGRACIGAVTLSEVVAKLTERGVPQAVVHESIEELGLDVRPFTAEQAMLAGNLRNAARGAGLSLGDRAGLALAITLKAEAVTMDAAWANIPLPVQVTLVPRRHA